MVHDQLRQLLLEHDCVTLPGLGALLAEPVPARIHPVRHTLSPPARRVAFSDRLRHDDGLLTEAVRLAMAAPDSAPARARVSTFTEELRAALRQHRAAELRGLGTLRQVTDEDPIRFEALEPGYLPLTSSFGLPELVSRPVILTERARATRYTPVETPTATPQLRPGTSRVRRLLGPGAEPLYRLGTATIIALLISATYLGFRLNPLDESRLLPTQAIATQSMASPQRAAVTASLPAPTPEQVAVTEGSVTNENSVEDFTTNSQITSEVNAETKTIEPAAPTPAPVVPKAVVAALSVSKPVTTIAAKPKATTGTSTVRKAPTNRFYLVWNAFSSLKKAEKGRLEALKAGEKKGPSELGEVPTVMTPPPGSVLYRVAVADFATRAEADQALPALRARYGPALWVLRY
jgi:CCDC81-like prokaryotic HU domain 1/SPOR domain